MVQESVRKKLTPKKIKDHTRHEGSLDHSNVLKATKSSIQSNPYHANSKQNTTFNDQAN